MEWTSFLGLFGICVGVLAFPIAIVVIFFVIRNNLRAHADRRKLTLYGVSAPAVILSAWNNYASGGGKYSRSTTAHVTFEVEIQPPGQAPFKAKFKDTLSIREGEFFIMGPRKEEVGKKIWVAYDPDNLNKMVIDHFDTDHEYFIKRRAFEKLDKRNEEIRRSGVEAIATILEVEDIKLANKIERDHMKKTSLRVVVEVSPSGDTPYVAETMGMYANGSLPKYSVGKKVYVKFNPRDRAQVDVIRSAEE